MFKVKGFQVLDFGESQSPAAISRSEGIVYINKAIWDKIPVSIQRIIVLHEEGHYILNTSSEHEADNYAFERFVNSEPFSLKNLIKSISETLSFRIPEHSERLKNQLIRAMYADYKLNGNAKVLPIFYTYTKTKIEMNEQKFTTEEFSKFLKARGYASLTEVNALPIEEREKIAAQFLLHPNVQRFFYEKGLENSGEAHYDGITLFAGEDFSNYADDFEDWNGFKKIGNWLKTKALPVLSKVSTGVTNAITKVAGPVLGTLGIKINQEKMAGFLNKINPINIANNLVQRKLSAVEEAKKNAMDRQSTMGQGLEQNTQQEQQMTGMANPLAFGSQGLPTGENMTSDKRKFPTPTNTDTDEAVKAAAAEREKQEAARIAAEKAKKTKTYILIGVGVVVVAIAIYFFTKKKS